MARDSSLYAQVGRRRRARRAALASLAALPVLVLAWGLWGGSWPWAGGPTTGPEGAAAAFARPWSAGDLAGAPTVAPAEEVRALAGSVTEGLALGAPAVQVTDTTQVEDDDGLAVATFRVTWDLDGHDAWTYTSSADLRRDDDGEWRVVVEPATLHPELHAGESLRLRRLGARRGDILGGDGQPVVTNRPVIDIGVEPSRTDDAPGLTRELAELLDVDGDALLDRIEAAEPNAFVPVITLREPDYAEVEDQVRPLPGTVFHARSAPLAPTREFARAVLGAAGPVTAELLEEHPERYRTGDVVGLSGLQRRFDERLFGRPGLEIVVIPGEEVIGSHAERPLHRIDPQPGEAVRTTLDEGVQLAADAALADVEYPSALVAILVPRPHSSGHATCGHDGVLELGTGPRRHLRRHRVPVLGYVEQVGHRTTVTGQVGVQPDPSVRGPVVAGDRVPQLRVGVREPYEPFAVEGRGGVTRVQLGGHGAAGACLGEAADRGDGRCRRDDRRVRHPEGRPEDVDRRWDRQLGEGEAESIDDRREGLEDLHETSGCDGASGP